MKKSILNIKYKKQDGLKVVDYIQVGDDKWSYNKVPLFSLDKDTFESLFIDDYDVFNKDEYKLLIDNLYLNYNKKINSIIKINPNINSYNFESENLNINSENNLVPMTNESAHYFVLDDTSFPIIHHKKYNSAFWLFENLICPLGTLDSKFQIKNFQVEGFRIDAEKYTKKIGEVDGGYYYSSRDQDIQVSKNSYYLINIFAYNLIKSELHNYIEVTKKLNINGKELKSVNRFFDAYNSNFLSFDFYKKSRYYSQVTNIYNKRLRYGYEMRDGLLQKTSMIENLANFSINVPNKLMICPSEVSNKPCLDVYDDENLQIQFLTSIERNSYFRQMEDILPLNTKNYTFSKRVERDLKLSYLGEKVSVNSKYIKKRREIYLEELTDLYKNSKHKTSFELYKNYVTKIIEYFNEIIIDNQSIIEKDIKEKLSNNLNEEFLSGLKRKFTLVNRTKDDIKIIGVEYFKFADLSLPDVNYNNPTFKYIQNLVLPFFIAKDEISNVAYIISYNPLIELSKFQPYSIFSRTFEVNDKIIEPSLDDEILHRNFVTLFELLENKNTFRLFQGKQDRDISTSYLVDKFDMNFVYNVYGSGTKPSFEMKVRERIYQSIYSKYQDLNLNLANRFNSSEMLNLIWNTLSDDDKNGIDFNELTSELEVVEKKGLYQYLINETDKNIESENSFEINSNLDIESIKVSLQKLQSNKKKEIKNVPDKYKIFISNLFCEEGYSDFYSGGINFLYYGEIFNLFFLELKTNTLTKHNKNYVFSNFFRLNNNNNKNSEYIKLGLFNTRTSSNSVWEYLDNQLNTPDIKFDNVKNKILVEVSKLFRDMTDLFKFKTTEGMLLQSLIYFDKVSTKTESEFEKSIIKGREFGSRIAQTIKRMNNEIKDSDYDYLNIILKTIRKEFDSTDKNAYEIILCSKNQSFETEFKRLLLEENISKQDVIDLQNLWTKDTDAKFILRINDITIPFSDLYRDEVTYSFGIYFRDSRYTTSNIIALCNLLTKKSREKVIHDSNGDIQEIKSVQRLQNGLSEDTIYSYINGNLLF